MVDDEAISAVKVRAYPKAAIEAMLARAASERARLRAALDAANLRISAAQAELAAGRGVRDRVATMVLEAEALQREQDAEVAGAVERMLESAEAESVAMTAAARADVARRRYADSMQKVAAAKVLAVPDPEPRAAAAALDGTHATQVA